MSVVDGQHQQLHPAADARNGAAVGTPREAIDLDGEVRGLTAQGAPGARVPDAHHVPVRPGDAQAVGRAQVAAAVRGQAAVDRKHRAPIHVVDSRDQLGRRRVRDVACEGDRAGDLAGVGARRRVGGASQHLKVPTRKLRRQTADRDEVARRRRRPGGQARGQRADAAVGGGHARDHLLAGGILRPVAQHGQVRADEVRRARDEAADRACAAQRADVDGFVSERGLPPIRQRAAVPAQHGHLSSHECAARARLDVVREHERAVPRHQEVPDAEGLPEARLRPFQVLESQARLALVEAVHPEIVRRGHAARRHARVREPPRLPEPGAVDVAPGLDARADGQRSAPTAAARQRQRRRDREPGARAHAFKAYAPCAPPASRPGRRLSD